MSQVERASRRYLAAGRFAHGFARGKMAGDPAYARVLEILGKEGTLVDVGCGEGHLLALAHEHAPELRLWGLDHDAKRIGTARLALGDLAELHVGDVRTQDLPHASVIAALDLLHYMPLAEQDQILARLVGSLEPGGVLLVRDGEAEAGWRSRLTTLSERVAVRMGRHKGEGVWLRPRDEMVASLRGLGLRVDAETCSEGTPFANVLYIGRAP